MTEELPRVQDLADLTERSDAKTGMGETADKGCIMDQCQICDEWYPYVRRCQRCGRRGCEVSVRGCTCCIANCCFDCWMERRCCEHAGQGNMPGVVPPSDTWELETHMQLNSDRSTTYAEKIAEISTYIAKRAGNSVLHSRTEQRKPWKDPDAIENIQF